MWVTFYCTLEFTWGPVEQGRKWLVTVCTLFCYLPDLISTIAVDTEGISKCEKSTKRLKNNLDSWNFNNHLTDTFSIVHLLSKLNSDPVAMLSCLLPINGVGLPYFKKYLKESHVKDKDILCLPVCNGVHFQGYVVNTKEWKIIYDDSLQWSTTNNPTSKCIAQILLLDECKIKFELLFTKRKQLDENSCGAWLAAGICSHILNLPPELTDREHAFDICYSLLEHKSKSNQLSIQSSSPIIKDQLKKFSTVEFQTDVLTNSSEKSDSYRELPPKRIRTNLFYITDLAKTLLANISTDDNKAYLKSRITNN